MLILVLVLSTLGLLIHFWLSPRKHIVHAAKARGFPKEMKPSYKIPTPQIFVDEEGKTLSRKNKFYGQALGSSMDEFGIPDRSEFIGEELSDELDIAGRVRLLQLGDIVVVDGPAKDSKSRLRLRKIMALSPDGFITFYPVRNGEENRQRSVTEVIAKVTHVAPA
jgi:hypothetical protein